jgi:GxxExxY protein
MKKLVHEELTGQIIACAIEVHKALGPGFLESIYEAALVVELKRAGLRVEQQKTLPIYYREVLVGEHRLDLLVDDLIVVELKAISALEDIHFAVVRSYLKAVGLEHGLLFNFATMPLTVKRVIYQPNPNLVPPNFS